MNIDMLLNITTLYAIAMGICIGGVAGYLGSLMVSKRMALMSGALGHLTLPGMALAFRYGFDISIGALIFLIFGILTIWALQKRTHLSTEALTAVVFTSSLALAFLILPQEHIETALLGNITGLSFPIMFFTIFILLVIFIIIRLIFSRIILITLSPDLAQVRGIRVRFYQLIYLSCIAITVAAGVRIIGGLMTAALVAIPACTSNNFAKNIIQYSYGSLIFGSISCTAGIVISIIFSLPIGPMIIISGTLLFIISLFFKK